MSEQPQYPGITIEELPAAHWPIVAAETAVTALIGRARSGPIGTPTECSSFAEFERTFGGLWQGSTLGFAVRDFFAAGGRRALIVRLFRPDADGADAGSGDPDGLPLDDDDFLAAGAGNGLYALDAAAQVNLLCIPPHLPGGDIGAPLRDAALDYAARRRALLIVDPPVGWDSVAAAQRGADDLPRHANGALYFPRLRQPNPLNGDAIETFVPCGAVAGVLARTDAARGVWKAPAGLEATIPGARPALRLSDAENGRLNPRAVNCLREFPNIGCVIWGARTLAGDDRLASEWKYVPVRRLALFIEQSLELSTRQAVFEPNDEPLWARLRQTAESLLFDLFRNGALAGARAADAFFVRCDRNTTSSADIAAGRAILQVGFAPLKPAEFVILTLPVLTS